MLDVVIENPILNSPFDEPRRHFKFSDEGITNEIVETRPVSSYFVPIAQPRKKGRQLSFDTQWTKDRLEENKFVNDDPLNLIIEVTGEKDAEKEAKVSTARNFWVPAVNNHGAFGRWAFLEIADPWDGKNVIRGFLKTLRGES